MLLIRIIAYVAFLCPWPLFSQEAVFVCQTQSQNLNVGLSQCWEKILTQWHLTSDLPYNAQELKKNLIDYSYKDNNIVLRFDKKKLFQYFLSTDIPFTGDLKLRLLLVSLNNKIIATNQDKFIIDIGKSLIEKCSWDTVTPNFDLQEIFLREANIRPPFATSLLSLPQKYKSFGLIGVDMDNEHNLFFHFIGPAKGHRLESFQLTSLSQLKQWLDYQIPESFFIQKNLTRAHVAFKKPFWTYDKVVTTLDNQVEIFDYTLDELSGDAITMQIRFHYTEARVRFWKNFFKQVSLKSVAPDKATV